MRRSSLTLDTSQLSGNEQALLRCQVALEFKDKGDYEAAREAMRPLWQVLGERPETQGLHAPVAAEVLLCVGILTRWIASKNQLKEAQGVGRDLISESITFYESIGDVQKVAAGRVELACCYWREGALDEARIMLSEALQRLTTEGNTRAKALLTLAVVEWSASRYVDALKILTDNALFFQTITNHTTKGTYHNQLAMVLRKLAPSEDRDDYLQRALNEYEKADRHFKIARNILFRADVKNNVGNLLRQLCRFKEAHRYLAEARRLAASIRDRAGIAQIDDTRAQVLIDEGKYKEAESVARSAVSVLDKAGHQCLLADALITRGVALARLRKTEQAQFTFNEAIEVAHQVGALNKAGIAALTLTEEVDELPVDVLQTAYDSACEWLSDCQSQELSLRLNAAAKKVILRMRGDERTEDAKEALFNKPRSLPQELLEVERATIRQTLANVNGSVTRAASLLGMSYQRLAYIIETRHKDLLKERSPVRRRPRKDRESKA